MPKCAKCKSVHGKFKNGNTKKRCHRPRLLTTKQSNARVQKLRRSGYDVKIVDGVVLKRKAKR